ncbi:carbohydrate ABC transporter permease [Paeniglutamicibacter terrestris]|uniref:Carbohydrate ABC transporter permease n=1 Tax=Paeniglutamicibacter terrestris TaxID=2723403 RepID=A0ABX1G504_9MICC|nr:carbohydrate ABC transporter permease [Paeniglutamicibacter terrestris]NKG21336.1 carbohydrate ABC transporter permease [Paeniglutamicibacter terrestris]
MSTPNSTLEETRKAPEAAATEAKKKAGRKPKRGFSSIGTMSPTEKWIRYVLLIVVLLICIGPFLWEFSTSLKGADEDIYTDVPSFFPASPTIDNYIRAFMAVPIFSFIGNSLFVAAVGVTGNIVFATLAGYAIARLKFRGSKIVLGLLLASLILPGEATIVSQFLLVSELGLADTLLGVALPGMVAPLNVLLMYNAFRVMPEELDQAGVIDGANAWQRLWHIGVPSVRGTIAVVAIFSFIGAWDDFLWPLIVLTTPENFTLTIGLQYLAGTFATDQRLIAAGAMIAFIPIAIVFAVLQRHFFKGVEEGGVKG